MAPGAPVAAAAAAPLAGVPRTCRRSIGLAARIRAGVQYLLVAWISALVKCMEMTALRGGALGFVLALPATGTRAIPLTSEIPAPASTRRRIDRRDMRSPFSPGPERAPCLSFPCFLRGFRSWPDTRLEGISSWQPPQVTGRELRRLTAAMAVRRGERLPSGASDGAPDWAIGALPGAGRSSSSPLGRAGVRG